MLMFRRRQWDEDYDRQEIRSWMEQLDQRMADVEASQAQNQAQIDADTALIQTIGPKMDTIKSEVDALKAAQTAGQTLDFSKLEAAVASVSTQADTDAADAAPTPPPTPPPAPPAGP